MFYLKNLWNNLQQQFFGDSRYMIKSQTDLVQSNRDVLTLHPPSAFQPSTFMFSNFLWHVRCHRGRQSAASEAGGRRCLATYMYLSSDSLLTRMSLILSIFKSSPSMLSTVMVESAMDTTSSSEGQRELLERGWAIDSCFPMARRDCATAFYMQIEWTRI